VTVATAELDALVRREHSNPHSVLGAHPDGDGVAIRVLRPAASEIKALLDDGTTVELEQIHPGGVFEGVVEGAELPLHYRLEIEYGSAGAFTIEDPYAFAPTIGELDLHLIGEGRHEELYEKLGAHIRDHQGVAGTAFAVWAPAAQAISVVGDFNSWDGRLHAMRSLGSSGIWELFLPGVEPGARYKYEILTADGELTLKADPFAQEAERPPNTA
jgi:1,4-alpha-glucan branching enzyme